jgi:hypothetical protein
MKSTKESKKKINFGNYVMWFPKGNIYVTLKEVY